LFAHTEENHPDYSNLKKALNTMSEVTKDVNEKKNRLEKQQAVFQVASHVAGLSGMSCLS
jgi:hypothetical protein